ncbi:unnamed protein product [Didymodactylos carnosus]|uniref:Beta-Casp domain-containing protein n=1 Tax=Didymodactylos carnosus TaxID=1234261 RepID=A0A813ZYN8_9BILA|nr:unnamed protein product [Didymodactylos carnosus]CAF3687752.1 unnamed protein product [Didymodactylos carnosus]
MDDNIQRRSIHNNNQTTNQFGPSVGALVWNAGKQQAQKAINLYANLDYLRPYFDVEPKEVFNRLIQSLIPKLPSREENVKPELYGPSMITFTLAAILIYQMKLSNHSVGYALFSHCVVLLFATFIHTKHDHMLFYFLWAVIGGMAASKMASVVMARTLNQRYQLALAGFVAAMHMIFLLYLHFAYHELAENVAHALQDIDSTPMSVVESLAQRSQLAVPSGSSKLHRLANTMRLYCLSDDPNLPCFILTVKGRSILLDYPLPNDHLLDYLPSPCPGCLNPFSSLPKYSIHVSTSSPSSPNHHEEDILIDELRQLNNRLYLYSPIEYYTLDSAQYDFSLIDIVLISNHETFLSLPYLYKKYETFHAQIYCTEPTYRFGQQLMNEFVQYQNTAIKTNSQWKLNLNLFDEIEKQTTATNQKLKLFSYAQQLMPVYTHDDIEKCLNNITIVHFNEQVNLYSSIRACAVSSGYALGSCNWLLEINVNHNQTSKIETSTGGSSIIRFGYSSSSTTLATHPTKMIYDHFKSCDYLLVTNLSRTPTYEPWTIVNEFTTKVETVLRDNGSVLIPCHSTGIIYDIFEFLTKYFEKVNLLNVQMYFISPISQACLSISNAMSEWVTETRQTSAFSGTQPFLHNDLTRSKLLINITSHLLDDNENLINFEQPCVVFAGDISLRFGPIVQLIEKLKVSSSNAIIFIDTEYSYIESLKPYQPMNMKCFYLPIDTRLNFNQMNTLLNQQFKPKHLIISQQYIQSIRYDHGQIISYEKYDNLKLVVEKKLNINGQLNIDLKPKLLPQPSNNKIAIVSVNGHLDMKDHVYNIEQTNSDTDENKKDMITYGRVNIEKLLISLKKSGLFGLEVKKIRDHHRTVYNEEENGDDDVSHQGEDIQQQKSVMIKYNNLAKIIVTYDRTQVYCNDQLIETKIKEAILENVGTL